MRCLVLEVFGVQSDVGRAGIGTRGQCPMSREELENSDRRALGRTKNGSAPGPDGISYRLIKAVKDTRLGRELIEEVVENLWRGVIPAAWRQMRVVFIPKPGRDLTAAKNWRPLNLINSMGKLGEKVVADRIQDFGGQLFHRLQYGSVRGRSAVDVLYRSVVRARACMDGGGSVGWGFWDVKVGFQNVVGEEVLRGLGEVEGTRGLCGWVEQFVAPRDFEVSWDGRVRGVGRLSTGVPQGSPLSPVLFLVWMAPILTEMERRIKEEVPGVGVEFPSYVDNLHCGLYEDGRAVRDLQGVDRKERMEELLDRVSFVLKEVAAERGLPLAEDKEERLVLRSKNGRRGRRGVAEKVKWLGVILDEDLDFGQHWEYRIGKARGLLGALDGVGSSKWGMSPLSWRQDYTGMVRSVTSWGVEVGWRGQREWRVMMEKLQYAALRKCTGAIVGARREYVRKIAAVEGVETFARAAAGRFLARTMCDPGCAGVAGDGDAVMAGAGELSLGGCCWRGALEVVDLGVGVGDSSRDWEEAIERVGAGCTVAFTDRSRDDAGRVAGGWCDTRGGEGCELVGSVATVWDGEIAGMRLALESLPVAPLLVLSDSRAAMAAVQNAALAGKARTGDLRRLIDMIGE